MDNKQGALNAAIDGLERRFGAGTTFTLGAAPPPVEVVSTGVPQFDAALGIGGWPKGRIVEVYGPEMSGKTTLALHAIASVQKEGGTAAFVDAEHALDAQYARRIGVDTDKLLVSQPDNGEQALEVVEALVRSGAVDIVVVDSVAALVPRVELEGEMGDAHCGLQARLMSQALRKLAAVTSRAGTVVLFTNQLRQKTGVTFGNGETTTGGNALKFYASVRVDLRVVGSVKASPETALGRRIRFKVVKNKLAPPFTNAEADCMFGVGFDLGRAVLQAGVDAGVIITAGRYRAFGGERLGEEDEAADRLRREDKLRNAVLAAVKAAR